MEGAVALRFLQSERTELAALLPGLDQVLARTPLLDMERPGSAAVRAFREHGGPGLLVPAQYGGLGATPLRAVRLQRALASRSPSLAVATAMHHFSAATLAEMALSEAGSGMEWALLEGVARHNLLVASAFAEGKAGTSVLSSALEVRRTPDGLVLRGSKKPCSLSTSMDILTASAVVPAEDGRGGALAVVAIPATTPGVERRPFWGSWALAGAESDEVILRDVEVPESLVCYLGDPGRLDWLQEKCFVWFELLITASYLGVAGALVERALASGKGSATDRVAMAGASEAAMASLEGVARALETGEQGSDLLARTLLVRYAAQTAIDRSVTLAAELLGGMAFVASPEVAYLCAASRGLAYHPPSRTSAAPALCAYWQGEPLVIP
jgi:alkylation response protein AidB-like acyl-CoA dehydrogenase